MSVSTNTIVTGVGQTTSAVANNAASILAMAACNTLRMPVRSMKNSWSNYSGSFPGLTVTISPNGQLEYSGLVKPSGAFASGQAICELPIGFAPDLQSRAPAVVLNGGSGNASTAGESILYGVDTAVPTLTIEVNGTSITSTPLMGVSARGFTSLLRAAIYWRNTTDNDDVSIVVPAAALVPGATVKVAIWCHGAADDYLSHLSDQNGGSSSNLSRPVIMGLLNDGWIVLGCSAKSTVHWGNPGAWTAQSRAIDWLKSWLNVGKMVAIGQSMGGTLSLRALASYPEITNWYGIYPVANITAQYTAASNAYQADIIAAYTPYGGYTANLAQCSPVNFVSGAFAGKRLLCTASPSDVNVPKASNADQLVTKALADGALTASVTATTGGHGDTSNFTSPIVTAMLAHLNS